MVCGGLTESTEHVFRDCHVARAVWFRGLEYGWMAGRARVS